MPAPTRISHLLPRSSKSNFPGNFPDNFPGNFHCIRNGLSATMKLLTVLLAILFAVLTFALPSTPAKDLSVSSVSDKVVSLPTLAAHKQCVANF